MNIYEKPHVSMSNKKICQEVVLLRAKKRNMNLHRIFRILMSYENINTIITYIFDDETNFKVFGYLKSNTLKFGLFQ